MVYLRLPDDEFLAMMFSQNISEEAKDLVTKLLRKEPQKRLPLDEVRAVFLPGSSNRWCHRYVNLCVLAGSADGRCAYCNCDTRSYCLLSQATVQSALTDLVLRSTCTHMCLWQVDGHKKTEVGRCWSFETISSRTTAVHALWNPWNRKPLVFFYCRIIHTSIMKRIHRYGRYVSLSPALRIFHRLVFMFSSGCW